MQKFKIIKDKQPLIRKKSVDVVLPIVPEDETLALDMLAFLKLTQDEKYRESHPQVREGIGLAAPQIGILKKIIVIHFIDKDENEITHVLVNPKIVSTSVKKCYLTNGEGCLSVDQEHPGYVFRSYVIRVEAYDALKKCNVKIKARGLEAIVLQHEIDHLFGILYYDHINQMNPCSAPEDFIAL